MANRAPTIIWTLRGDDNCGYVRTTDDDGIQVVLPKHPETLDLIGIEISRKDARLLAKRLNACLDETTKGTPYGLAALRKEFP